MISDTLRRLVKLIRFVLCRKSGLPSSRKRMLLWYCPKKGTHLQAKSTMYWIGYQQAACHYVQSASIAQSQGSVDSSVDVLLAIFFLPGCTAAVVW